MPDLARITVYPVKSLDGITVETATVGDRGALALDRQYAIVDADGAYVNGKATAAVHRLRSTFDPATHELTLSDSGDDEGTFCLRDASDRRELTAWLSAYFDQPVDVVREAGGSPDDKELHGPTVISTGTLREVADWFDRSVANVRRRFRANLELDVEVPFWEDRLFGDEGEVVPFEIGDVSFEGVNPCQRCVVPTRDPETGEETEGFRERFVEKRRETLPPWTDSDRFDHPYRLMVNTTVPEDAWGERLAVGDPVSITEPRPLEG